MKKGELLRKYSDVISEIVKEYIQECGVSYKNDDVVWKEYLERNVKIQHNFTVLRLKNESNGNVYYLSEGMFKGDSFNTRIPYVDGIERYTITRVKFGEDVFEVADRVLWNGAIFRILGFKIVNDRLILEAMSVTTPFEESYKTEIRIEDVKKRFCLGKTDDGYEYFLNDELHWIMLDEKEVWKYLYISGICESHSVILHGKSRYKVFKHESSALAFIEQNNKKPLFKTIDGKDIYEGDKYWYLHNNRINEFVANNCIIVENGLKRFSTKELAEEYILENSKLLSIEDVKKYLTTKEVDELFEFVKTKK